MKNKHKISTENRKKIKKEFFLGDNASNLALKYGYTVHTVKLFLEGRATKTYIDSKGVERRKCSNCGVYKKTEFYNQRNGKNGKIYISNCKSCYNLVRQNKRKILQNNKNKKLELKEKEKKYWENRKVKTNFKRRINRIIKYTDSSGRILKKN